MNETNVTSSMRLNYFAYGSNMFEARLKRRVPSARFFTTAVLQNYALKFHKRSVDGSGKCTVVANPGHIVHGVVYSMPTSERVLLDKVEGLGQGYDLIEWTLQEDESPVDVFGYIASDSHIDANLKPYDWYKALVVAGAKQHGLPSDYIAPIEAILSRSDPDAERAKTHWDLLKISG